MNLENGRIPPQAIDIERAILGACLLEKNAFQNVENILNADVFYKEAHQIIWKQIERLNDNSEPVDMLTVTNALKDVGKLDEVGGPYYISQLTSGVASAANTEYHARLIYEKYMQREVIKKSMQIAESGYEDFEEMMMHYGIFTEHVDQLYSGESNVKTIKQVANIHSIELDKRIKKAESGGMTGISTGLYELNKITNGWQPSDLIIIAARPGMGKTAVALKEAKSAAEKGFNVLMFSLEMDNVSLFDRIVCSNGGINSDNLKAGKISHAEMERYTNSASELSRLPIYIDDTASVNLKHMRATARQKHRKGECDMIIIDYLQLVESQQVKGQNREQEVAKISRGLKLLAKELNIPVILLAQLSRAVETRGGSKKPILSDLRESGAIEQDADKVLFIYRPAYYGIMESENGKSLENIMFLNLAKHRNGAIQETKVRHSVDLTQIYDYDQIYEETNWYE